MQLDGDATDNRIRKLEHRFGAELALNSECFTDIDCFRSIPEHANIRAVIFRYYRPLRVLVGTLFIAVCGGAIGASIFKGKRGQLCFDPSGFVANDAALDVAARWCRGRRGSRVWAYRASSRATGWPCAHPSFFRSFLSCPASPTLSGIPLFCLLPFSLFFGFAAGCSTDRGAVPSIGVIGVHCVVVGIICALALFLLPRRAPQQRRSMLGRALHVRSHGWHHQCDYREQQQPRHRRYAVPNHD